MFNKGWRLWRAKKSGNTVAISWNQRKFHNLVKSLKSLHNIRKSHQERAVDVTDIARTQDILRQKILAVEHTLNRNMSPKLTHLLRILDPKELEKDRLYFASDVIKNGTVSYYF